MTQHVRHINGTDKTTNTIARIDAQNTYFVNPLRDIFVAGGSEVTVNHHSDVPIDYHIICGDLEFVKDILSRFGKSTRKRLVIINDGTSDEGETRKLFQTVLIDLEVLTDEIVEKIFRFFFTSKEKFIDLRKNPKMRPPVKLNVLDEEQPHVVEPSVDTERIQKIIQSVFLPEKKEKIKHKKKRKPFQITILVLLILFSPFIWYALSLFFGVTSLGISSIFLRSSNVNRAMTVSSFGKFWIQQGDSTLHIIAIPFVYLDREELFDGQEKFISFLHYIANAMNGVGKIFQSGRTVARLLMTRVHSTESGTSPAQDVEILRTELFSVQNSLGLAQSELQTLLERASFPFWFSFTKPIGLHIAQELASYRNTLSYVDKFLLLYPRVSGFSGKQTYLILLQNSLEIRPTGGFIGSIARLSTEDGILTDLEVQDVYAIDGQLKGHVDPPGPIRDLLGQEHWYLRDSNWDPGFDQSATRAAWFYEKETGIHVDGVLAISTPLIVKLLEITGPLNLVDYNDQITSQNFYGKFLHYTKSDFFPGSTQKKDFLGTFMRTFLDELFTDKGMSPVGFFRVITAGLLSRDLMFYSLDPELGDLVSQFGWSGKIFPDTGCAGLTIETCIFDPVMSVEANVGVNKVNYFVKRSVSRNIEIGENGHLRESVDVSLENTSPDEIYKTYIRFLLPLDAEVEDIRISGQNVPVLSEKKESTKTLPYTERIEYASDYQIVGVAAQVLPGTRDSVSVEYSRTHKLSVSNEGAYLELFTQKQPGIEATQMMIYVQYPLQWEAESDDFIAKDGTLEYNSSLSQDRRVRIFFHN